MSSTIATAFYDKYKDKYKCLLHCSKSNDDLKELLKDVEDNWVLYQTVIYSPSVEAGVSFNKPHFDKKFVVLSKNSCSPRSLMQMISRIRQVKENVVDVYLNGFPFKEKACFYNHDDVYEYVMHMYKKYIKPVSVKSERTGKMVLKYEISNYTKTFIYNEKEKLNKDPKLFVALLIKLIVEKGHTYKYDNEFDDIDDELEALTDKGIKKPNIVKQEILNAEDIDGQTYGLYLLNQKMNKAERYQKVAVEKYLIKKNWKVDSINEDFLKKFYGKTYILFNLRYLLGKSEISAYQAGDIIVEEQNKVLNFNKTIILEQIEVVKDVVSKLGFDLKEIGDKKLISRDDFLKNIEDIQINGKLYLDPNRSKMLFGYYVKKFDGDDEDDDDENGGEDGEEDGEEDGNDNGVVKKKDEKKKYEIIKPFMGFINRLLKEWGLVVCVKRMSKRIKVDGKNKFEKRNNYYFDYYNKINQYL